VGELIGIDIHSLHNPISPFDLCCCVYCDRDQRKKDSDRMAIDASLTTDGDSGLDFKGGA
jgi:hypothetical protein